MLNLTLLAPLYDYIVAAILDNALPDGVSLFDLAVDVPAGREEQNLVFQSTYALTLAEPVHVRHTAIKEELEQP